MKTVDVIKTLRLWDLKSGRFLFRTRELGLLFSEGGNTLRSTMKRLIADDVLERVAHDVYLYKLSYNLGGSVLYEIAAFIKLGEFCYESFESASSQWGVISQIPLGRITVATTGSSGIEETPYGTIEYTHVERNFPNVRDGTVSRLPRTALPIASKARAVEDLIAHKRSLDLIDWEAINED